MPRSGMYPGLLGVILGARYVVGRSSSPLLHFGEQHGYYGNN